MQKIAKAYASAFPTACVFPSFFIRMKGNKIPWPERRLNIFPSTLRPALLRDSFSLFGLIGAHAIVVVHIVVVDVARGVHVAGVVIIVMIRRAQPPPRLTLYNLIPVCYALSCDIPL